MEFPAPNSKDGGEGAGRRGHLFAAPGVQWKTVPFLSQNVSMPRVWVFLLLSCFLAGCGPKLQVIGGYPTDIPRSMVSLSPSTTELVATYGDFDFLKGRTASCNFPVNVKTVPIVAPFKPDYEKLKQIKPDLVVFDDSLYSPDDIAHIEMVVGKQTVYQFHSDTIDAFEEQLRQLATILDSPTRMSEYIDRINSE